MGKAGNNCSSQETTLRICSCGISAPQNSDPWPKIEGDFSNFFEEYLKYCHPGLCYVAPGKAGHHLLKAVVHERGQGGGNDTQRPDYCAPPPLAQCPRLWLARQEDAAGWPVPGEGRRQKEKCCDELMCLKSRKQWQKAVPTDGFNIPDPFFTVSPFLCGQGTGSSVLVWGAGRGLLEQKAHHMLACFSQA